MANVTKWLFIILLVLSQKLYGFDLQVTKYEKLGFDVSERGILKKGSEGNGTNLVPFRPDPSSNEPVQTLYPCSRADLMPAKAERLDTGKADQ